MANFNSSVWYQLYINEDATQTFWGSELFKNHTSGSVYFRKNDTKAPENKWQLYGINDTTYVLRSSKGGADGFLGTMFSPDEDHPGRTRPRMVRNNVSDDSIFWHVSPWGDGTFYMTNDANKTEWRLRKLGAKTVMDSNISDPQPGQRWSFQAMYDAPIVDASFSTVDLPGSTVSSPATLPVTSPGSPTSTSTSASTSDGTNSSSSSGGLSAGAKAGIGAGVGGVALIALVLLGLFLWRRRQRGTQQPYQSKYEDMRHEMPYEGETVKYEMNNDNTVKHEMPGLQEQPPVELPNNTVHLNAR